MKYAIYALAGILISPIIAAHPVLTNCNNNETVIFSCEEKSKSIAICLTDDEISKKPKILYRFAKNNKIELQYPATGQGLFYISNGSDTKGRHDRLRFSIGDFEYIVYSISHITIGNHAGILVLKNKKKITQIKCSQSEEPWPIHIPQSLVKDEEFNYAIEEISP